VVESRARALVARCESCGNLIDEEDHFCSNCGREAAAAGEPRAEIEGGFTGFDCESCGASLTFDSEAQGLRCAFCGSVSLVRQPAATGRIRADAYLPFAVTRDAALAVFKRWIGRSFFRPFGFAEAARVVSMHAVYIPCWRFHARAHTYYTADSSEVPAFARASWRPVFGERSGEAADVLVPASGSLRLEEVTSISPFDFSGLEPYAREALQTYPVEDFGISRRGARPRARALMIEGERAACAALVPGRSRNVRVNTLFFDLRSDPVLLPVWINAYRFKDVTYRFVVNGQTGKLMGRAPRSLAKLALVVLGIAAAALIAGGLASLF
jgi:LSD1 subclass zinc finger protein